MKLFLNVDGAARGNPGPAAIGVTLKDESRHLIATISECLGETTNNQAEYKALISGLKRAISLGATQVQVYSDSELMVRQINGIYRVKNDELKLLHAEAKRLAANLENFKITSIGREKNREADLLANRALDAGK